MGGLEWGPVDDTDQVIFAADYTNFRACLTDYTTPTEQPDLSVGPKLEYLRWLCGVYAADHPEIVWRIWTHPNRPDMFWLQIGAASSMVDWHEAHARIGAAGGALRAYKAVTRPSAGSNSGGDGTH